MSSSGDATFSAEAPPAVFQLPKSLYKLLQTRDDCIIRREDTTQKLYRSLRDNWPKDDVEGYEMFLKMHPQPRQPIPALYWAIENNHMKLFKLFLSGHGGNIGYIIHGAPPYCMGRTALHWAAATGAIEAITKKLFDEALHPLDDFLEIKDCGYLTPLDLALMPSSEFRSSQTRFNVVHMYLSRGAYLSPRWIYWVSQCDSKELMTMLIIHEIGKFEPLPAPSVKQPQRKNLIEVTLDSLFSDKGSDIPEVAHILTVLLDNDDHQNPLVRITGVGIAKIKNLVKADSQRYMPLYELLDKRFKISSIAGSSGDQEHDDSPVGSEPISDPTLDYW